MQQAMGVGDGNRGEGGAEGAGIGTCHPPLPPPKKIGKTFSDNYHAKFAHFSGKRHVKFGYLVIFFRADIIEILAF